MRRLLPLLALALVHCSDPPKQDEPDDSDVNEEADDQTGPDANVRDARAPADARIDAAAPRLELACGAPERALARIERAVALVDRHGDGIDNRGRIDAAQLDCLSACGLHARRQAASLAANDWLDAQLAALTEPSLRASFAQMSENQRFRAG
jgi:hypothetical protein